MQPAIKLSGVSKRYGSQTALNNVSLEIPPGVVFGLLGENGAGKTTLMRILLGLVDADAGEAQVLGLDCRREGQAIRGRVGYVPERPVLYEWMTVDEIGWFTAAFYLGDFQGKYRELIERFRLPRDRKIKALSKGMRAKVSLALAMAHDPPVLLLDEPTSGLDALVRREFLESTVDLAATGKTVLLSSHQIAEVERVAEVVGILRCGELVIVERLDALKEQVHWLVITMSDMSLPLPELAGQIISRRRRGRQWQLVVRDLEADACSRLALQNGVLHAEARRASLEEIFVAYMESRPEPAATRAAEGAEVT